MSRKSMLSALLLLLLTIIGCERRPLEVHLDERVHVRIIVRWQVNYVELYGSQPNGMTVMIWGSNDPTPIVRTTNADNVSVMLAPDTYRMIIFNELAEEYAPYVNFFNAYSYDSIAARAAHYLSRADGNSNFMYTPEDPRIAVALDTFVITPEMVLEDTAMFVPYEEYKRNGYSHYRESERVFEIPEVPWPMTVDLYVQVRMKNRQSLKTVEGSLSGLADGFYLSKIIRTTETGTLQFNPDNWDRYKYDDQPDNLGSIVTRMASFGLPYGKELLAERDSADNILSLSLTLYNDTTLNYQFKVGKNIQYITPEGKEARIRYRQDLQNLQLIIVLPDTLDLPYVTPPGGAGFYAEVDEWEDGGTFDLGGF